MNPRIAALASAAVLSVAWHQLALAQSGGLSPNDRTLIRRTVETYRTAWLAGDAQGVLRTLTEDCVLLPAGGASPVQGIDAIRKYWWPAGGPPTRVTRLDITVDGLSGNAEIASSYGRDDVAWTTEENGKVSAQGHPGTYLNVYRKLPSGEWRIARHMWGDGPPGK
jgi:uncharacterized protein (TIGR02246 family)